MISDWTLTWIILLSSVATACFALAGATLPGYLMWFTSVMWFIYMVTSEADEAIE